MPTENRSSNTEMVSVPRELLERLDLGKNTATALGALPELRAALAQPTPQPHAEPIAWMVDTAFWWTKEEAERDAAETGLPIVGLGPMTAIGRAEQHQGEPVGLPGRKRDSNEDSDVLTDCYNGGWNACLEEIAKLGPLYTRADPGEVERLSQIIRDLNEERDELGAEAGRLRAQLAGRDALLEDWHTANCTGEVNVSDKAYRIVTRTAAILSPGAKPIALGDQDDRSDIAADAAYRNGVMHGYKLAMEGDEAEYQACINSLTGHLQTARAALNHKPS
ncbi:hypothetical protein [Pseudomonas sp. CM27]|uniref:hypothetical protein n=1 Tax=Pseudomonas sp. CM27 TaxID=2738452 RepID=UPI0015536B76|nr:hypothetical protein [Pseudomonas sp. CM27]NQD74572.1 hypothetical protein [Pseudomonas sp. CM27]